MKKITLSFLMIAAMAAQVLAQGVYIEFKITSISAGVTGTIKNYSQDGNTRSEFTMASEQMPSGFSRVTLALKDKPKTAYVLNEKLKSYSEMDLSSSISHDDDPNEYEVTVLGKEKVNGYNCTHIKLKLKTAMAEQEMWLSTEVVNYKAYQNVKGKYTSQGLFKALAAKGVEGFLVRAKAREQGGSMVIDLVKAELKKCDASLFSLAGYTKEAAAPAGSAPADLQEMAKKLQSMTPEERQKFMEKLKEKANAPK